MSLLFALLFALLPTCAHEDSTNCAWDASTQGNGVGTSFIDLAGVVIHESPARGSLAVVQP